MATPKRKVLPNSLVVRQDEAMQSYAGLGPTQFSDLIKRGGFPRPFELRDGGRTRLWLRSELDSWLASRLAARDATKSA